MKTEELLIKIKTGLGSEGDEICEEITKKSSWRPWGSTINEFDAIDIFLKNTWDTSPLRISVHALLGEILCLISPRFTRLSELDRTYIYNAMRAMHDAFFLDNQRLMALVNHESPVDLVSALFALKRLHLFSKYNFESLCKKNKAWLVALTHEISGHSETTLREMTQANLDFALEHTSAKLVLPKITPRYSSSPQEAIKTNEQYKSEIDLKLNGLTIDGADISPRFTTEGQDVLTLLQQFHVTKKKAREADDLLNQPETKIESLVIEVAAGQDRGVKQQQQVNHLKAQSNFLKERMAQRKEQLSGVDVNAGKLKQCTSVYLENAKKINKNQSEGFFSYIFSFFSSSKQPVKPELSQDKVLTNLADTKQAAAATIIPIAPVTNLTQDECDFIFMLKARYELMLSRSRLSDTLAFMNTVFAKQNVEIAWQATKAIAANYVDPVCKINVRQLLVLVFLAIHDAKMRHTTITAIDAEEKLATVIGDIPNLIKAKGSAAQLQQMCRILQQFTQDHTCLVPELPTSSFKK